MTKYIKGKDGKFQGSIGEGRDNTPVSSPTVSKVSEVEETPAPDLSRILETQERERNRDYAIDNAVFYERLSTHPECHEQYDCLKYPSCDAHKMGLINNFRYESGEESAECSPGSWSIEYVDGKSELHLEPAFDDYDSLPQGKLILDWETGEAFAEYEGERAPFKNPEIEKYLSAMYLAEQARLTEQWRSRRVRAENDAKFYEKLYTHEECHADCNQNPRCNAREFALLFDPEWKARQVQGEAARVPAAHSLELDDGGWPHEIHLQLTSDSDSSLPDGKLIWDDEKMEASVEYEGERVPFKNPELERELADVFTIAFNRRVEGDARAHRQRLQQPRVSCERCGKEGPAFNKDGVLDVMDMLRFESEHECV